MGDGKQPYEPPQVVSLNKFATTSGACGPGSNDAGECAGPGASAGYECVANGNSATTASCVTEGNTALGCFDGGSP